MSIREHKYSTKLNFLMKVAKYRPAVVKYPYLTSMGYYGAHTDWKSCLHLCSSLKSSNIIVQVAQHMKAHCKIMWKKASTDLSWREFKQLTRRRLEPNLPTQIGSKISSCAVPLRSSNQATLSVWHFGWTAQNTLKTKVFCAVQQKVTMATRWSR